MDPTEVLQSNLVASPPLLGQVIDVASKSAATFAVVLYGCGFLISSIYYSSYGFVDANPLRPRIAFAGAWFILFIAIPVALMLGVENAIATTTKSRESRFSAILCLYCVASLGIAGALADAIFSSRGQPAKTPSWIDAVVGLTLVVTLVNAFFGSQRPLLKVVRALASVGLAGYLMVHGTLELVGNGEVDRYALASWFLLVAILVRFGVYMHKLRLPVGFWTVFISGLLLPALLFSQEFYPRLSSSWGGGSPVKVTLYFTNDSIFADRSVTASLIDETDSGFYVLVGDDPRATYIPRKAVGLAYYADYPPTLHLKNK